MRKQTSYWQIAQSPKFVQMVQKRRRITRILSWMILVLFALFTLSVIYTPKLLGTPISDDSALTIGIIFSFLFIFTGVLLSGYYTWWANTKFDPLQAEVIAEFENQVNDD